MKENTFQEDIESAERFRFGSNWKQFLDDVDDDRIALAIESLKRMLGVETLSGKSFLDIGSGSGLFSLAARSLGATVVSFDFDPESVACTTELKRRYFENDDMWTISEASVLDADHMGSLQNFDVVYSWGVLHHTGDMWEALNQASRPVASGGQLFIAIYNDQGGQSKRWTSIKSIYNKLPDFLKVPYTILIMGPREIRYFAIALVRGKLVSYYKGVKNYSENSQRGMSYWRDIIDWVGGYPFEVAKPEEIFEFYQARGFQLEKLKTKAGSTGCCEYVFLHKGE